MRLLTGRLPTPILESRMEIPEKMKDSASPWRMRIWIMVIGGGILGIAGVFLSLIIARKSAPLPPAPVVTSSETTRILEPVTKDGRVDYITAMNRICAEGTTPQDNAVAGILMALGPSAISDGAVEPPLKILGIEDLPEEGDYFLSFDDYLRSLRTETTPRTDDPPDIDGELKRQEETLDRVTGAPWSAKDHPHVAGWIERNKASLDLLVRASGRSRYYFPRIALSDPPILMDSGALSLHPVIRACHGLACRAMSRVDSGDIEGAWRDSMAIRRLGRGIAQDPEILSQTIGVMIDGLAFPLAPLLARWEGMTERQLRKMLAEMNDLGEWPDLKRAVDVGERFQALDTVFYVQKEGLSAIAPENVLLPEWDSTFDPNVALRVINSWYDRFTAPFDSPDFGERQAGLENVMMEFMAMVREAGRKGTSLEGILSRLVEGSEEQRIWLSEHVGKIILVQLVPALDRAHNTVAVAVMMGHLWKVAVRLELYRLKHGGYPAGLDEVAPGGLSGIPTDLFSVLPLRYVKKVDGFLLYSVGLNGKDEGGAYDEENNNSKDDIAVRVGGSD